MTSGFKHHIVTYHLLQWQILHFLFQQNSTLGFTPAEAEVSSQRSSRRRVGWCGSKGCRCWYRTTSLWLPRLDGGEAGLSRLTSISHGQGVRCDIKNSFFLGVVEQVEYAQVVFVYMKRSLQILGLLESRSNADWRWCHCGIRIWNDTSNADLSMEIMCTRLLGDLWQVLGSGDKFELNSIDSKSDFLLTSNVTGVVFVLGVSCEALLCHMSCWRSYIKQSISACTQCSQIHISQLSLAKVPSLFLI
jgi:hypothetical protein